MFPSAAPVVTNWPRSVRPKQTPFVELEATSNPACSIRIWQQGDRVTLAATDCADKCARGAFDYAWPVAFKTVGSCY